MLYQHRKILESTLTVIPAQKQHTLQFCLHDIDPTKHSFKLRLRGDVDVQQNWMWEGGYPLLYRDIDDSLDSQVHDSSPFSLHFHLKRHLGAFYPRRAYCKLPCPPELTPQFEVPGGGLGDWRFSVKVKAEKLALLEDGQAGVQFEFWKRREDRLSKDINCPPDAVVKLPFAAGSYDFTQIEHIFPIGKEDAMILVTFYAENCEGDFWLEDPRLERDGQQILPPFTFSNSHHEYLNWLGENLSHKEWTDLGVSVNGQALPSAELFQRCHRGCEHEIPLPDDVLVKGDNTITLQNENDYFGALPFRLMQCELLYEERTPFSVIYYPDVPEENRDFPILVSTREDNILITLSTADPAITVPAEMLLEKSGLHVIKGKISTCKQADILLSALGHSETVHIERTIEKEFDNVLTGTSDSIYIPQDDKRLMEEFLAWYFKNRLGNFITFRPVYRWTGARELAPETWEEIRRICTELSIWFCHIIDGRELPGMNANPTKAMLASPYFVGNQGHERDGALYYWRPRRAEGIDLLFNEVTRKNHRHPDYRYSNPIVYTNQGNYLYFDPVAPKNMEEAALQYVERSRESLDGIKRHTGPSVLFKYFFMAGLEVGGAETMYGPQEIILSALRGASLAYHRKEFAAHLAVQWSSTPHDTPERFARYRLALYGSYLQGVNHINTEEGLYRMEELFSVFDRFSDGCKGHLTVQQEFTEFVNTHSRRGKMRNLGAILHGRYDGWVSFTRPNVWAHEGTEWKFGQAEESWDLLTKYYPDSKLKALYVHPCPNEPQGFFSRTPFGNVDILPIEAEQEILRQYPYMAFLGYNAATAEQIAELLSYVKAGGKLLLTLAHLNASLLRAEIAMDQITPPATSDIAELLGFTPDYTAESGELIQHTVGLGTVYLINSRHYPAHPSIRAQYETCLMELTANANRAEWEKGFVETEDTVQFAVYDQENGTRSIYLINTNWWNLSNETATATLRYGSRCLPLEIPFGRICTLTLKDGQAVFLRDNTSEVISMEENGFLLQGDGECALLTLNRQETNWHEQSVNLCGKTTVTID